MDSSSEIVRMGLIRRKAELNPDQFRAHWRGPHGTLASAMPGLLGYHQNHRIENYPLTGHNDRWNLDGLSELWFPNLDAMRSAVASPAYAPVAADTPDVMTMPGIIAGIQMTRLHHPKISSIGEKLMVIATRRGGGDAADIAGWWNGASLVAGLDHVAGVVDTIVTHREASPGREVAREALPVDLVVEVWFEDGAALAAAVPRISQALGSGAGQLLQDAALYRTRTHVVVDRGQCSQGGRE
ncbi:EthD domain-containing protein [Rhizobiaceae sp. 2RAB30]